MSNNLGRILVVVVCLAAACGGKKKKQAGGAEGEAGAGAGKAGGDGDPKKTGGGEIPQAAARGPEHAVFSLADNRLLAHLHRNGGLVIDVGSPGLGKYLHAAKPHNHWVKREQVDGRAVVNIENYALLEVPLDDREAKATKIWLRIKGAGAGRVLSLEPNGKTVTQPLADGWATMAYEIPGGALVPGENVIRFVYTKGAPPSVAWVQIGGTAAIADDAKLGFHAHLAGAQPKDSGGGGELTLPKGAGLTYYVKVPKGGLLAGDVPVAGCSIDVTAQPGSGAAASGQLVGRGSAVDLGAVSDQIVRLDLANNSCDEAKLSGGALVVGGSAPTVDRSRRPKNVVLWINDSLRADRIPVLYPSTRVETPFYTQLAQNSAWFRNAYVQGNESRASHASIWTAAYPVNHRMITGGAKLSGDFTTIDEVMKKKGMFTSGVSANGYIVSKWGFGTQWDAYRNTIHEGGGVRGENLTELGVKSLEKHVNEPFFLYLGLIDNHVSWRAKEPWMAKYDPEPYTGPYKTELTGAEAERINGKVEVAARDKQRVIAIYDSNVSYADDLMQKFFEQLKTWGVADDTMVIMTADHGDELWEDGKRIGHGGSLRDSLVHVPLLIHYPPLFPGGVIEEGVDTVDILPTIIDAIGGEATPEMQGESLIPLAQGVGRGYPRPAFASKYEDAHTMRLGGWKLYAGGKTTRLFDVDRDPEEKTDLAEQRPVERRFVMDSFSLFMLHQKVWNKRRWGVVSNALPAFAADLE